MRLITIVTITVCVVAAPPGPRKPRLTVAESMPSYYSINNDGAYSFGYDLFDPATGNTQFRSEERYPNGTVAGSYGFVDALGKARSYKYVADERGYRVISEKDAAMESANLHHATVTTESTITWKRPNKKKPQDIKRNNVIQTKKYNTVRKPGYYIMY